MFGNFTRTSAIFALTHWRNARQMQFLETKSFQTRKIMGVFDDVTESCSLWCIDFSFCSWSQLNAFASCSFQWRAKRWMTLVVGSDATSGCCGWVAPPTLTTTTPTHSPRSARSTRRSRVWGARFRPCRALATNTNT